MQLVRAPLARPECLSASAVDLVKDTLAKGCVLYLVRHGGWRNDKYLHSGSPTSGRVWDRIPLDERNLTFSRPVLEFLIWATAEKVNDTRTVWDAAPASLTPADEFFFWLTLDSLRGDPDLLSVLRRKDVFRRNPFCWISFPGDMVEADDITLPDFSTLCVGQRAVFLECLQTHLTQRWIRSERMKSQLGDWKKMRLQGRVEFAALHSFLHVVEQANRSDLARFVLRTNAALFATEMLTVFWTGGLQGSGPPRLADRIETQRAALALPRLMETLENWQERARSVGYFDTDYQATQMWKSEWEALEGDRIAARARAVVEMLEPLRTSGDRHRPGGTAPPGSGSSEGNPGA
jgi:hypothetical protein